MKQSKQDAAPQTVAEQYQADLLKGGRVFHLHALSHAGRRLGYGPVRYDKWARVVRTLGEMASRGDALAQLASKIVVRLPLYQTEGELCAAVWRAAAAAITREYDDVVGRAAPDASGRPSSYRRDWNLRERVLLCAYCKIACSPMTAGVACWGALREVADANGIQLPRWPEAEQAEARMREARGGAK